MKRANTTHVILSAILTFILLLGFSGLAEAFPSKAVKELIYKEALEQWKDIEAKAKQEGEVVVYGWMLEDAQKAFRAAFKKRYPEIDLKISFLSPRECHVKIKAEQASKKPIGDFAINVSVLYRMAEHLYQDPGVLPELLDPNAGWSFNPMVGKFVVLQTTPCGAVVNTNLVPAGTEPKSFKDVTDPKWKGKFNLDDPRIPGMGRSFFRAANILYGESFLKKVVDNKPILSRDPGAAVLMVARGEYPFSIGVSTEEVLPRLKPGVPIKMIIFEEGGISTNLIGLIPANVRHPNAARVFLNFLMSEEGQRIFGEVSYVVPIRGGVIVPFPEYQDIDKIKWLFGIVPTAYYDLVQGSEASTIARKLIGE
jgi:iron(III) transport system substrate-binding protein